MAGLLTVSGLVFCIAWSNSNRHVIRPLRRVIHVAEGVAAGRQFERTGLAEKSEIGRLARTFDSMADSLQREKNESAEILDALRALTAHVDSVAVDASSAEVRRIATKLRLVALGHGDLASAIEWLASDFRRRSGVECVVQLPPLIEAGAAATTCIFRMCQESLTNVAGHAHAARVDVVLTSDESSLTLTVRDDGRGFPHTTAGGAGSLGLLGMRERARIAGGTLRISSNANSGTVVSVRIPARRETSSRAAAG